MSKLCNHRLPLPGKKRKKKEKRREKNRKHLTGLGGNNGTQVAPIPRSQFIPPLRESHFSNNLSHHPRHRSLPCSSQEGKKEAERTTRTRGRHSSWLQTIHPQVIHVRFLSLGKSVFFLSPRAFSVEWVISSPFEERGRGEGRGALLESIMAFSNLGGRTYREIRTTSSLFPPFPHPTFPLWTIKG